MIGLRQGKIRTLSSPHFIPLFSYIHRCIQVQQPYLHYFPRNSAGVVGSNVSVHYSSSKRSWKSLIRMQIQVLSSLKCQAQTQFQTQLAKQMVFLLSSLLSLGPLLVCRTLSLPKKRPVQMASGLYTNTISPSVVQPQQFFSVCLVEGKSIMTIDPLVGGDG